MNNDVAGIKEILIRRMNHPEWGMPNLIVIDGGLGQINVANNIIKEVPIVSVVKDITHKADHFLGNEIIIKQHSKAILLANAEAHRFAIAYHKKIRSRRFLK